MEHTRKFRIQNYFNSFLSITNRNIICHAHSSKLKWHWLKFILALQFIHQHTDTHNSLIAVINHPNLEQRLWLLTWCVGVLAGSIIIMDKPNTLLHAIVFSKASLLKISLRECTQTCPCSWCMCLFMCDFTCQQPTQSFKYQHSIFSLLSHIVLNRRSDLLCKTAR